MRFPSWLKITLGLLIIVGIVFRFVNLNHKVYWHDEVYTSMRASGYTHAEVDRALFQNRVIAAQQLQTYQQIKPGSTVADTIQSLAKEVPQHPPLYFLITRFWMQSLDGFLAWVFKSSLTTARSLPALLSLLALPAMYALAWELFASPAVALMATTLLALSPFDVLFAQTARQYSLLTVMILTSSFLLLRSLRLSANPRSNKQLRVNPPHPNQQTRKFPDWLKSHQVNWGFYALAIAVGFYTHSFFWLTLVSHAVYIHIRVWLTSFTKKWQPLLCFWGTWFGAIALYSPWLWVILHNRQQAIFTGHWVQIAPGFDYFLKLWILSFTSLFFDLSFGLDNLWTFLPRIPFVLLIIASGYLVCRQTHQTTRLFLLITGFLPFLCLVLPDLILGSKRSAISRYLIASYPAIQLIIAYTCSTLLSKPSPKLSLSFPSFPASSSSPASPSFPPFPSTVPFPPSPAPPPSLPPAFRYSIPALICIASIVSLTVSASAFTWWNKDLSYFNDKTAQIINATAHPIVISDIGDDYTNTGDLISLSYLLKHSVPLLLVKNADFATTAEFQTAIQGKDAIAFRPSQSLSQTLQQTYGSLTRLHDAERLWKIGVAERKNTYKNTGA
jgi:uncharacterized membrane protein